MPGRRRDNGLYLEKFETKEEAIDYIKMLKRKYLYTPNPKKMSIRKLCRYAKNEGVVIYKNQLSQWLKDMGVELRVTRPKEKKRYRKTLSLNQDVIEKLENFPNQSYIAELGLKIIMGVPTEDLVMFIPVEEGEEPVNVIFQENDGKIKAIATGELKKRDRNEIAALVRKAQREGMGAIVKHAKLFKYKYHGKQTYSSTEQD